VEAAAAEYAAAKAVEDEEDDEAAAAEAAKERRLAEEAAAAYVLIQQRRVARAAQNQPGASVMLVIDREADKHGLLMAAALPEVVVVVEIDSVNDSAETVVSKIDAAYAANGGTPLTKIAFANHGGAKWQLASDCVCRVGPDGFNIADALPVISALVRCAAKEGGRIDLLGCRLLKLDPQVSDKLEKEFEGLQFTASDDDTGNRSAGGDWIMESDGLDIAADYFDAESLKAYSETMYRHEFTIEPDGTPIKLGHTVMLVNQYGPKTFLDLGLKATPRGGSAAQTRPEGSDFLQWGTSLWQIQCATRAGPAPYDGPVRLEPGSPTRFTSGNGPAIKITVKNQRELAIEVVWCSDKGELIHIATIQGKQSNAINTSGQHVFLVRDVHTLSPLVLFEAPTRWFQAGNSDTVEIGRKLPLIRIPPELRGTIFAGANAQGANGTPEGRTDLQEFRSLKYGDRFKLRNMYHHNGTTQQIERGYLDTYGRHSLNGCLVETNPLRDRSGDRSKQGRVESSPLLHFPLADGGRTPEFPHHSEHA